MTETTILKWNNAWNYKGYECSKCKSFIPKGDVAHKWVTEYKKDGSIKRYVNYFFCEGCKNNEL